MYLRSQNSYGVPQADFLLTDEADLNGHWHALALRKTGTLFDLFVDGDLFGSQVTSIPDILTAAPANFGDSYFWSQRGDPQYFAGSIDEARIYNRALSNSEIQQLAGISPSAVPEPATALLLLPALALLRQSRRGHNDSGPPRTPPVARTTPVHDKVGKRFYFRVASSLKRSGDVRFQAPLFPAAVVSAIAFSSISIAHLRESTCFTPAAPRSSSNSASKLPSFSMIVGA